MDTENTVVEQQPVAKKYKIKTFEVRDGRVIAKFLIATGLKETLFNLLFPKNNSGQPDNWVDLRKYVQAAYSLTDAEFREFQQIYKGRLPSAIAEYQNDFPETNADFGKILVEKLLDIFADDGAYDATMNMLAYLCDTEKQVFEGMSFTELYEAVSDIMANSGFLALLQPSTPQNPKMEA